MEFRIDELKIENLNSIVELYNDVYEEIKEENYFKKHTLNELNSYLEKPNTVLGIYNDNNELVGFGAIRILEQNIYQDYDFIMNNKKYGNFELVMVNKDYRGRAFQKVLLQVLEEVMRDYNINLICATINKDNYYANRNMYKSGYKLHKTLNNNNLYFKYIEEENN